MFKSNIWYGVPAEAEMKTTVGIFSNQTDHADVTFDGHACVVLATSFLIICSNSLVLVVVSRARVFQSVIASRLILTLATVDLLIGFNFSTYVPNVVFKKWMYGEIVCTFSAAFSTSILATEFWIIALISLERYVAICRPLHYHRILSRKTCIAVTMLTSLWLPSFIIASIILGIPTIVVDEMYNCLLKYDDHKTYLVIGRVLGAIVPVCAVTFSNIQIFRVIRRQKRCICVLNKTQRHEVKVDKGSFVSLLLVMISLCTIMPMTVVSTLNGFTNLEADMFWLTILILSNSFWNIFVYIFWNKRFRQELIVVLLCRCCKHVSQES